MIRCRRHNKANGVVVNWPEGFVYISRIGTIEKEQKSAVFVFAAPVQLYKQTIGLLSRNEVIVKTDTLAGNKFVSSNVYIVIQFYLK